MKKRNPKLRLYQKQFLQLQSHYYGSQQLVVKLIRKQRVKKTGENTGQTKLSSNECAAEKRYGAKQYRQRNQYLIHQRGSVN